MAQNREKDETLELKVPTDTPLSLPSPNCIIPPPHPRSHKQIRPRDDHDFQNGDDSSDPAAVPATEQPGTSTVYSVAKRAVNRCSGCRKRVGLTGFRCRCGDLFCSHHRYSDRHDCTFDYKAAGREAIARENPVVRAAKILKV